MKRFLAILLATIMVFALFGCQSKGPVDKPDNSNPPVVETPEDTTPETPNETESEETEPEVTEPVIVNGLGETEVSLYNPNAPEDTSLVTIVGYLPFKADCGVGTSELIPDAAVQIVDMEEPIRDRLYNDPYQYVVVEELAFVYQLGVGTEKYSIANVVTSNYFDEMMAKCYTLTAPPEKLAEMCVGFIVDQYNCIGAKFSKDYKSDWNLYGDNWYTYKSNSGKTDKVDINFKETDEDIYYLGLNLNEAVDITVDAIAPKVENKEFKDSIIFLSDINDFTSKTTVYGKDVDLNNTVFYQDAIAMRMSNDCGLNLRNKEYFKGIDNTYIIWDMYDADGYRVKVTYNAIERPYKHSKYAAYYEATENVIERVCGEDTYVYSNPDGGKNIYVFKNGECTGKIVVEYGNPTPRTTYENLNMLFGFKPDNE